MSKEGSNASKKEQLAHIYEVYVHAAQCLNDALMALLEKDIEDASEQELSLHDLKVYQQQKELNDTASHHLLTLQNALIEIDAVLKPFGNQQQPRLLRPEPPEYKV